MKIAFYGSSLLSSYWNGAATYYRGLLKALAMRGAGIVFFEPDVFDRQANRDMEPPDWARVVVWPGTPDGLARAAREAGAADVVVKASGVGYEDDLLLEAVMAHAAPAALRLFWDVDAPATLAEIGASADHALRRALPGLDAVMTYGGGEPVVTAYRGLGARDCVPVYNGLDPQTHHPVEPVPRFSADLAFLGNRLPDREARVTSFFIAPAARLVGQRFILGGSGWGDRALPPNVDWIGHVPTADHNALNASAKAVLNINRQSMASVGFSPPTRVFEAAGAGACLITDDWEGIDLFFEPGEEILVVRDGNDLVDLMTVLDRDRAAAIGRRALARALAEHTYERRAEAVDGTLRSMLARKRAGAAA